MKIHFFTIFLGFWVVGLMGMDSPMHTPLSSDVPAVFTPNSKKTRTKFIEAFATAIYGKESTAHYVEQYVAQCEADNTLMQTSPTELFKVLYGDFKDSLLNDFEAAGVTPDLVALFDQAAENAVKVNEATFQHLPPASSPIRKVAEQVMRIFPHQKSLTVLKVDDATQEAAATGSLLLINEDRVKVADDPREASWLCAHELYHAHDEHQKERMMYRLALKSLSPNKTRDRVYRELKYFHETTSDVGGAIGHSPLAKGYKMRADRWAAENGEKADVDGDSHPADRKRQRLANATIALHEQHQNEQHRAERPQARARMGVSGKRTALLLEEAARELEQEKQK